MTPVRPPPDDGINDEVLMMFADGTLDEDMMETVARAIEADKTLAERLAVFTETGERLKGAFAKPINEQPPERLLAAIMAGSATLPSRVADASPTEKGADILPFAPRPRATQAARQSGWLKMALAAGFAGIAAGVSGFMLGQDASRPATAVAALANSGGMALAGLDSARDGQTVSFGADLAGSVSGSYRMSDRRICRTLSVSHPRSGSAAEGVACQSGGGWRMELALPRDDASAVFRPATGAGPIDALLEAGGAEAALPAAEVDTLIKRNWR